MVISFNIRMNKIVVCLLTLPWSITLRYLNCLETIYLGKMNRCISDRKISTEKLARTISPFGDGV